MRMIAWALKKKNKEKENKMWHIENESPECDTWLNMRGWEKGWVTNNVRTNTRQPEERGD